MPTYVINIQLALDDDYPMPGVLPNQDYKVEMIRAAKVEMLKAAIYDTVLEVIPESYKNLTIVMQELNHPVFDKPFTGA